MRFLKSNPRLAVLLLILVVVGILRYRKEAVTVNPVDEISVGWSGVVVVDRDIDAARFPWPAWRGPQGHGVAPDQPLPTEWSDTTGVLWRADVPGRGHSSPVVIGNTVCLATALSEPEEQQVAAWDRSNGQLQWTTIVHTGGLPSGRELHGKSTHANGTIACDGRHLYTAFLNSDSIVVTALTLSGDIVWQQEAGKFVSRFGYAASPIIYKSLVIVAADNSGGSYLAALDGETGAVAWRTERENVDSYSSPTVATVGGRDQLLISGGDNVISYDPATGKQLWVSPHNPEATCGTIVTTDDLVFASGGYPSNETVCLNGDGKRMWADKTRLYEPSLVVLGDNLIGVTDRGIAHCWNTTTGELVWRERLSGNFSASPLVCNGRIYVSNLSGDTFVFTSQNGAYQQVSQNKLGNDCYASPAAVDGKLFLRIGLGTGSEREEQLVCIGE